MRLENSMATTPTTDLAAAAAPLSPQSVPAAGQSQQAGQEAAPTPNSLAGPFAAVSVMPTAAAASPVAPGPNGDVAMADVPVGGAPEAPAEAAAAAAAVGGPQQAVLHYYDDPNPGRALAMLEVELSSLNISDRADPLDPSSQRLRQLLEMEVAAMSQGAASVSPGAGAKQRANVPQPSDHGILRGLLQQKGPGLQVGATLCREKAPSMGQDWQGLGCGWWLVGWGLEPVTDSSLLCLLCCPSTHCCWCPCRRTLPCQAGAVWTMEESA